jgi:hypothetical protein
MSRIVAIAVAVTVAVLGIAAGLSSALQGSSAGRGAGEHFQPSAKVRAMLAEVSASRLRGYDRALVSVGTRNTLSEQNDPEHGIGAARDFIFHKFQQIAKRSHGRMTVRLQSYIQQPVPDEMPRAVRITNVVATLRGSQAASVNRVYVVSGHYDSRCTDVFDAKCLAPGADDDASGVSAVIEMARVMASRHFDATIVFMAVAGEEQGLFGSTHFAEVARQQHLNIAGMFTNDIVGTPNGAGARVVRLFSEGIPTDETPEEASLRQAIGGENDGPARQMARFIKSVSENSATGMQVKLIFRRDRYLRGGDNIPFLENGYRSSVRFTEIRENFNHQHQDVRRENGVQFGDLMRFVNFPYLARVTRVNVAALASLADAPAQPANTQIVATELTNSTTLVWHANTEPDLKGYEVVWRDTTAPLWQHSRFIGKGTRVTLPISKDNVLFGVRALDRLGHRSPVSFPTPLF